jgi:hypothetical protein
VKKRTHRKHRPGLHPLDAITACQPFPEAEVTRILLKVHDAFARLRNGSADPDMFDRIAAVLNVGMVRCEQIGGTPDQACNPGVATFIRAQAALMACDELYGRHKRFGFTGPGLEAMKEAIALYEQIIRESSPKRMHLAQQECMRRVAVGQFQQAEAATAAAGSR